MPTRSPRYLYAATVAPEEARRRGLTLNEYGLFREDKTTDVPPQHRGAKPVAASFRSTSGWSIARWGSFVLTGCGYGEVQTTEYYAADYTALGVDQSDGTRGVYRTPIALPAQVRVGDSGSLGTIDYWADPFNLRST